jgi:hypothetical protein
MRPAPVGAAPSDQKQLAVGHPLRTRESGRPQDPLTARYRTETLECPQPSGRTQLDHREGGRQLRTGYFLEASHLGAPVRLRLGPPRWVVAFVVNDQLDFGQAHAWTRGHDRQTAATRCIDVRSPR